MAPFFFTLTLLQCEISACGCRVCRANRDEDVDAGAQTATATATATATLPFSISIGTIIAAIENAFPKLQKCIFGYIILLSALPFCSMFLSVIKPVVLRSHSRGASCHAYPKRQPAKEKTGRPELLLLQGVFFLLFSRSTETGDFFFFFYSCLSFSHAKTFAAN